MMMMMILILLLIMTFPFEKEQAEGEVRGWATEISRLVAHLLEAYEWQAPSSKSGWPAT
jgi:hypothetical protein